MDIFSNSLPYRLVAADAANGRLAHAYLLVCPDEKNLRGFLKSLAKLIMRADARAERLIEAERYVDCRIFPAEGERAGVAEVKQLLEDCYIKPAESDRKLFVLNRVHAMLAPAQNKLLKVLEEPPANVYFLLGAASEFAVLPTVRSRTRKLELFAFPEEEIAAHIRRRYPFRTDAREIAALSGGALGRAEALAEGGSLAGAGEKRGAVRAHSPLLVCHSLPYESGNLLRAQRLVVGQDAGASVGVERVSAHPGGVAVDGLPRIAGGADLPQYVLFPRDDRGERHHLTQAEKERAGDLPRGLLAAERSAARFKRRCRHAGRQL